MPFNVENTLPDITLDSLPISNVYKPLFIKKADELGLHPDDLARLYLIKNKIDPTQNFVPSLQKLKSITSQNVAQLLSTAGLSNPRGNMQSISHNIILRRLQEQLSSPTLSKDTTRDILSRKKIHEEERSRYIGPIPQIDSPYIPLSDIAKSASLLRNRPTSDIKTLEEILQLREQELADTEEDVASLMERASSNMGLPNAELEESLRDANEKRRIAEHAVSVAASNLSDVRGIEEDRHRDEITGDAIRQQQAADAEAQRAEPPLPAGVQNTMHNLPAFLGGRTGFAGKNIAALERELAQPYRPYRGERIAGLDPLQRLSQDQARSILSREKGMTSMYGKVAQAVEGTMGERSSDMISPYLAQATHDPVELAEKFRIPYDKQMAMVEHETLRNLKENILPAIHSRFNVRNSLRGKREDIAARDISEFLAKQREAFAEKSMENAYRHAGEYAGRNLSAAQISGGTHTSDASRIADTARALHTLGAREQERALQGANVLGNIGAQSRAQRQEEIAAAMAAHKEQQEYPLRRRALATSIAYGTPVNSETLNMMSAPANVGANSMTQAGGLLAALGASQYANLGKYKNEYKGGSIRSKHNKGGRVRRADGGLMGGSTPFQRGTEQAMDAIGRHKQRLEDLSMDMDRPNPNPIWPWLMKTGLGVAASNNPNTLQAIGQAGYNSMDVYENAIKAEEARKERAAKIHEAIIKTHQLEEDNTLKRKLELDRFNFERLHKGRDQSETGRHNKEMELIAWANSGGKQKDVHVSPKIKDALTAQGATTSDLFSLTKNDKEDYGHELPNLLMQKKRVEEAQKKIETGGPMGIGFDGTIGDLLTALDPSASLADRQNFEATMKDVVLKDEFEGVKGTTNKEKHKDFMNSKAGLNKLKEASRSLMERKKSEIENRIAIMQFKTEVDGKLPQSVVMKSILDWNNDGAKKPISSYVPEQWRNISGIPSTPFINTKTDNSGPSSSSDIDSKLSSINARIAQLKGQ